MEFAFTWFKCFLKILLVLSLVEALVVALGLLAVAVKVAQ